MGMRKSRRFFLCAAIAAATLAWCGLARAASLEVDVYESTLQGRGAKLGTVTVSESKYGLVFTADLKGLPPGLHGFHIHTNPECGPGPDAKTGEMIPSGAAGGHYDPHKTGKHGFPWEDDAHLGDLPALYVGPDGMSNASVHAPRLKTLDEVRGRSLMIHAGGDNYSDHPKPLGGGGARMACGVIR